MAVAALTPGQFDLVYNMLSLGLASMAASTVFFFLRLGSFAERYKAALCFTGLVTFIAMYHYFRIFDSFNAAYTPCETINGTVNYAKCDPDLYGDSSALMIANGYPGEITADPGTRWVFWALSMAPFTYIVYSLFVGLKASQDSQPEAVRDQVRWACWATVFSWCTYPIVFVMPMLGGSSNGKAGLSSTAMVGIQVGYTFSDIISKCGVGYLVYRIGLAKSMIDHSNGKAGFNMDEVEALAQDEEE